MNNQLTLLEGIAPNPDAKPFRLSARQLRAIKQFSYQGLRVQISAHPVYTFVDKESGLEENHHIQEIEDYYDTWRKEMAANRKRGKMKATDSQQSTKGSKRTTDQGES